MRYHSSFDCPLGEQALSERSVHSSEVRAEGSEVRQHGNQKWKWHQISFLYSWNIFLTAYIQAIHTTMNTNIKNGEIEVYVADGTNTKSMDCISPLDDFPILELTTSTAALPFVRSSLSRGIYSISREVSHMEYLVPLARIF